MKIVVTARELLDAECWAEACDMLGINIWAINEGLMHSKDELTLTPIQALELGLIRGVREGTDG